mgnify:CR=1 FL=1
MFESSKIVLSKKALEHNLKFLRKHLKPKVRICSVVKGNAYGHGLETYVQMALRCGIDYFGVHSADEAFILRENLPDEKFDLFIMGTVEDDAIPWAIESDVEMAVFDFDRLDAILNWAEKLGKPAKVHLEIETGMRRTGFEHTQIDDLIQRLGQNEKHLIFQGLFTHFAGAESLANHFRVKNQIENFRLTKAAFEAANLTPKYWHSACSAATLNYPESQENMVRIGIIQYGFWPNKETHIRFCGDSETNPDLLKRIIHWETKILSTKDVKKGCFVGYGTSYLAHNNMKIAIVPVGYSHGYSRNLSNIGSVLIHGKSAPVIGTVNMNSLTIDVSKIPNVDKGDTVILIGRQNGKAITVSSFSEQSHQLNYEMLTRLPRAIPREIVD